jgi:two-component system, cell cycle sensor histidine kinase and response regulator CckA
MNEANHRILVIDDNASIHADFRKILGGGPAASSSLDEAEALLFGEKPAVRQQASFEIDCAFQGQEGLKMVREAVAQGRPYAMAFVDVRMPPGWDGIETISHIWRDYPELQVVICTAYSDYSWEEIVKQLGKTDSLVILKKPFDNVEVLQLAHALTKKWALAQQARYRLEDLDRLVTKRTAELQEANRRLQEEVVEKELVANALRLSEERFSKAFRASPIPLAIRRLRDEHYLDVNDSFLKMTGFGREEVVGKTPAELRLYEDPEFHQLLVASLVEGKRIHNQEVKVRTKSAKFRDTLQSMELFELGAERHLLVLMQDVSDQLSLETQLRQAQKMEAVGQLAAGVAHDFNNMLMVIQGHVSLLLLNQQLERKMANSLEQVASATQRAANLTRQLLTFSRKQIMQTTVLDLNAVIHELTSMLRRVIGEHITLRCEHEPQLPLIRGDMGCLEQALVNLAVNAKDAMPKGGTLLIRTARIEVDEARASRNPEAKPGPHICVTVTDTGCGMDQEVLGRIFEPFFTTKDVGKGTGLGLATVYGIIKQHEGWIEVVSQVGQGTTFSLFLPVASSKVGASSPAAAGPAATSHNSILVVEDDEALRNLVSNVLREHGYRVFVAGNGTEALRIWNDTAGAMDLVFTDVVMPGGISGRRLGNILLGGHPRLKVLLTSAYPSELAEMGLKDKDRVFFLPKPYRLEQLPEIISCLLSGNSARLLKAHRRVDPDAMATAAEKPSERPADTRVIAA